MSSKKILLISSIILVLGIILFGAWHYYYTMRNYEAHVELVPGQENRITLVNIGDGDRAYIAKLLLKVDALEPSGIGLDAFFSERKDDFKDSLLAQAIDRTQPVLGRFKKSYRARRSLPYFFEKTKYEGLTQLNADDHHLADTYRAFMPEGDTSVYSMAHVLYYRHAGTLPIPTTQFQTIKISRLQDQFTIYDFEDLDFDPADIQGKIVLLGYLGPTDEDKFRTWARYETEARSEGPDTYGVVLIANQLVELLEKSE